MTEHRKKFGGSYHDEGDDGGGSGNANESHERHEQVNPFRQFESHGSIYTDDSGELNNSRQINPFSSDESGRSGFDESGRSGFDESGRSGFDESGRSGFDESGRSGFDKSGRSGGLVAVDEYDDINRQVNQVGRRASASSAGNKRQANQFGRSESGSSAGNNRQANQVGRRVSASSAGNNRQVNQFGRRASASSAGNNRQANQFGRRESGSSAGNNSQHNPFKKFNRRESARSASTVRSTQSTTAPDTGEINSSVNPYGLSEPFSNNEPQSEDDIDDIDEINRQVNAFSLRFPTSASGSVATGDSVDVQRRGSYETTVEQPAEEDDAQVNPFSLLKSDEAYCRGAHGTAPHENSASVDDEEDEAYYRGAYDTAPHENSASVDDEEKSTFGLLESDEAYCRRAYDTAPHENCASVYGEDNFMSSCLDDMVVIVEETRSGGSRKKVKNRHCKAAIMVCVVWGITVILLSIILGMDWFDEGFHASDNDNLCTLCGDNGLDFILDKMSTGPTRLPSSSEATFPFSTIDPPPANLAELCAPSIRLSHTSPHNDPLSRDLVGNCIKACLPAMCCLVNNKEARDGLLPMLGSQEVTSAYLSTVEDCYVGGDVPVCEAYNEWCATLYSLDFVLEESLPAHFFDSCHRNQEHEGDITVATSRASNPVTADGACEGLCRPLACCYGDGSESDVVRKRDRRHEYDADGETDFEIESRRRVEDEECLHFDAQDPLNAQICDAYAPFCIPYDNKLTYTIAYPASGEPSGVPTQMGSLKPSARSSAPSTSLDPTFQPSSSAAPSTSLDPTFRPSSSAAPSTSLDPTFQSSPSTAPSSEAIYIPAPLSLVFAVSPASSPYPNSTSRPSLQQAINIPPSNENISSSFTPDPSLSFIPTTPPSSIQRPTTNFPSGTTSDRPTTGLSVKSKPSTPSSIEIDLPTQQPSSPEIPTGDTRNSAFDASVSQSERPSVSPSSHAKTPSVEPTQSVE